MTKAKEASQPKSSNVLEEITNRLSQIGEDDCLSPEDDLNTYEGQVLGVLTGRQKRMWTLQELLRKEINSLIEEHNSFGRWVAEALGNEPGLKQFIQVAKHPKFLDAVEKQEELDDRIAPLNSMYKIVRAMFWYDVRASHATFEDKSLTIDTEWRVLRRPRQKQPKLPAGLEFVLSRIFR